MTYKDEDILEYLRDIYPSGEPPTVIHYNLTTWFGADWSLDTTRRRLERLDEKDFVEIVRETGSYYRITEDGTGFLEGDVSAKDR